MDIGGSGSEALLDMFLSPEVLHPCECFNLKTSIFYNLKSF